MKPDQERVKNLLTDTVSMLCRNGLGYQDELRIEGLIGITLDNNEVFLVPIHQAFFTGRKEREKSEESSRRSHLPADSVDLTDAVVIKRQRGRTSSTSSHASTASRSDSNSMPCSPAVLQSTVKPSIYVKQEKPEQMTPVKSEPRSSCAYQYDSVPSHSRVPPLHDNQSSGMVKIKREPDADSDTPTKRARNDTVTSESPSWQSSSNSHQMSMDDSRGGAMSWGAMNPQYPNMSVGVDNSSCSLSAQDMLGVMADGHAAANFLSQSMFVRKRRSRDSSEKPFVCPAASCGKAFFFLHHLHRHQKLKSHGPLLNKHGMKQLEQPEETPKSVDSPLALMQLYMTQLGMPGMTMPPHGAPPFVEEHSQLKDAEASVDKLSSGGECLEEDASDSNTSVENTGSATTSVFPCMDQSQLDKQVD